MPQIRLDEIVSLSHQILKKHGVSEEDLKIIIDTILYAHKRGKETHGVGRVPIYARKIKEGYMSASTILKPIKEAPVISVFDVNNGFGQVAASKGMSIAVKKAAKYGIGVVGIKGSNNFGVAGYYAEMAVKEKMIGLVLSNSGPAIAPWGASKPLFGTNPIAFGFPGGHYKPPVILDMASSNAARGKIRLAGKNNEKIPFGWALDADGNPTNNPLEALKGSMIPIGEHKGYGLALAVDILAGLLTGAAFGGEVKRLNHPSEVSDYGHLLIAINISHFLNYGDYLDKMDVLTENIKKAGEDVYLPGEKSYLLSQNKRDVVNISAAHLEELKNLLKI